MFQSESLDECLNNIPEYRKRAAYRHIHNFIEQRYITYYSVKIATRRKRLGLKKSKVL